MAGTINRMPIEKMKAEFDAKGATYGKTISKKIKPYINKVCETLADTSIFHAKQRQEVNTIKQQLGIPPTPHKAIRTLGEAVSHTIPAQL